MKKGLLGHHNAPTISVLAEQVFVAAEDGSLRNRSGQRFKASTIRIYRINFERYLAPEFGSFRVNDLRRRHIQQFCDRLAVQKSPSTVRNVLMPLRSLLRYAVEMEFIAVNPIQDLRLPGKDERPTAIVTPDMAGLLLASLPRAEDRAIYATGLYAGLRLGEIRALRWKSIDFAGGIIRVEASWDAKEGETEPKSRAGKRNVPLLEPLREIFGQLSPGGPEALVFPNSAGKPFNAQTLYKRTDRELAGLGLPRVRLHACRHSFASYAIAAGLNMKLLSTFMGHASISITIDRYGHLLPGSEADAGAQMTDFLARA